MTDTENVAPTPTHGDQPTQAPQESNVPTAAKPADDQPTLNSRPTRVESVNRVLAWLASTGLPILAAGTAIWYWGNSRIQETIEKRVRPYEQLLNGIAFNETSEYELAIDELERSLDGLEKQGLKGDRLIAVIDPYLYAIVNSEDPSKHEPKFRRVRALFGEKVATAGWHHEQFGWYYFQTNEISKAKQELQEALTAYRRSEVVRNTAFCRWLLTLISLVENDVDTAVMQFHEAAAADSRRYGVDVFLDDSHVILKEGWYKRIESTYPQLKRKFPELLTRLRKPSP